MEAGPPHVTAKCGSGVGKILLDTRLLQEEEGHFPDVSLKKVAVAASSSVRDLAGIDCSLRAAAERRLSGLTEQHGAGIASGISSGADC
jgi:hypothetical protein